MGSARGESLAEGLASRFERLWNATGTAPDLVAFLQLHPEATLRDRAEVVRVDQRRRWQMGQPRALDEYFRTFPDLAAHPSVKLALVVAEYRTAARLGRPHDREAFLSRFADVPSLRERIEEARPAVGPSPAAGTSPLAGPSPDAARAFATQKALPSDELVIVPLPKTDGVYDFVDHDGILAVEPEWLPAPVPLQPQAPRPVRDDSDFAPAKEDRPRSWPERVLARRAAAWHADPSLSTIPWPWEWAAVLVRTDRSAWTRRQRAVMAAAGRFYLIGTVAVALLLCGVGLAGRYFRRTPRPPIELAAIEQADPDALAKYVKQLDEIKAELAANRGIRADELLDQVDARWRDWEWRHLKLACGARMIDIPTPGPFGNLLISGDGRRLAASCDLFTPGARPPQGHYDGRLRIWELADGSIRELTTISTTERIWQAALTADGHRVAALTENAVVVWDVEGAKEKEVLRKPWSARSTANMALAPDGAMLAIAKREGPITVWKVPAGEEIHTLGQDDLNAFYLVFAPRGGRLVAEGKNWVGLWDPAEGRQLMRKPTRLRNGWGVAVFSPDGSRLAGTDDKGVIRVWDAGTGAELASLGTLGEGTGTLAFSPDGKQLASSVGGEWSVILWDIDKARKVRTFSPDTTGGEKTPSLSGLQEIAFSPDGSRLAGVRMPAANFPIGGRSVLVWDVKTGGMPENVPNASQPRFLADGRMAYASAAASTNWAGLGVWDMGGARMSLQIVAAGAPSPDGSRLVTIGGNQIISADDGRLLKGLNTIYPINFADVYYSPSGRRYVTVDRQRSLRFWDAATDEPMGEGRQLSERERLVQFLFSAKGERLITVAVPNLGSVADSSNLAGASSNKAVITVWDPERGGEPLVTLQGYYHHFVGQLSISPDGTRFAAGSLHETVRVYDTDSGSVTWDLEGHTQTVYASVFSPDGRHLITSGLDLLEDRITKGKDRGTKGEDPGTKGEDPGTKGEVKVWDLETGRAVREFPGPALVTAISPDGRLAFAADLAGFMRGRPAKPRYRVWDLTTGETRYELQDALGGLAFTPDGKRFATVDRDAVHLRETTTGTELLRLPLNQAGAGGPPSRNPLIFAHDGGRLLLNGRLDSKHNLVARTVVWFAPEPPAAADGGQGQGRAGR